MISEYQKSIFRDIEAHYSARLPIWMRDFKATGNMTNDPYFRDWIVEFTPIEASVWSDIRCNGLDFFPQIPACGFFLDFANPFLKIAIECDGADFHDYEKDSIRDGVLQNNGWTVFRITGSECTRIITSPFDDEYYYDKPASSHDISEYFNKTSEGILIAIKAMFFDKTKKPLHERHSKKYINDIRKTVLSHCTTPITLNKLIEVSA